MSGYWAPTWGSGLGGSPSGDAFVFQGGETEDPEQTETRETPSDQDTWAEELMDWGLGGVAIGAGTAGTGAILTQADTFLPGPADVVGAGFIIAGAGITAVGAGAFVVGSVGQLFDGE